MRLRKIILCVDDNETVLGLRRIVLETHGFRVLTAMSGEEAILIFEQQRPHLVLTDLIMPGMNGNDLAARLKDIDAEVPVIIYSGATMNYSAAHHADSFLPKGASAAEMLYRVKLLTARKPGAHKKNLAQSVASSEALRRSA